MEESVYCKICCEKCSGIMELKIHIESHKKRPNSGKRPTKSFNKDNNDDDEPPTKSLKKNNDDDEPPTESLKKDNQYESFNDYNRLERKYVECNVCQKICANESALRNHCQKHVLQNHEKCGVCSKIFRNAYTLQKHFKSSHGSDVTCDDCGERFRSKEGFSLHVCSKTYPCNVCNHVFRSKDELLKHFFIHKSLQGSYLHFTND